MNHVSVGINMSVTTLSEIGEVRGISSATTVNSLVNFGAMTGTDSNFAAV